LFPEDDAELMTLFTNGKSENADEAEESEEDGLEEEEPKKRFPWSKVTPEEAVAEAKNRILRQAFQPGR